jgi:hypothetical protein
VTIFLQNHQIPDLARVRAAASGKGEPIDLEGNSTYSPRWSLGEYRCTSF